MSSKISFIDKFLNFLQYDSFFFKYVYVYVKNNSCNQIILFLITIKKEKMGIFKQNYIFDI